MVDMASLLKLIIIASRTWNVPINLVNGFFPSSYQEESQKQFAFFWDRQLYTFMILPQGSVTILPCCSIVQMEDDNLGFSQTCFFTILMTLCYSDPKIVSEFAFHMQPYYRSPRFTPLLCILQYSLS